VDRQRQHHGVLDHAGQRRAGGHRPGQQTLKWRVKTGSLPADVYGSPDDKTLFIGLTGGEGVEVFDIAGGKQARWSRPSHRQGRARLPRAGDRRHIW
jgi:hypothetical protein